MSIKKTTKKETYKTYEEVFKDLPTIGRALWALRTCDELTQKEFAKKLGISESNLSDIETGRKKVGPKRAAKFANLLDAPVISFVKMSLNELLKDQKLDLKVEVTQKAS